MHEGRTDSTPEEVGYELKSLDHLEKLFLDLIRQQKLQCAGYRLSRYGKVFAHKSMGPLSGISDKGPFLTNSIRRLASITKAFTSVATMKLIEDGKLYLDQPVHTIIAELNTEMHKGITIFHLLTHTSGIVADQGYFLEPYTRGWLEGSKEQSWIIKVLAGPLLCKPGESWSYSSMAFLILGEVISRVAGKPFEEYVHEAIIEPLGLKRTFFHVPEHLYPEVCVTESWDEERMKSVNLPRKGLPPQSAGGLFSTMEDVGLFGQMLLNNGELNGVRVLGRKTVEALTRNHLTGVSAYYWGFNFRNEKYGLGLALANNPWDMETEGTFSHEGAGRTALYIDPVEQFVAVYFVPTPIHYVPESLIRPRNIIWSGIR